MDLMTRRRAMMMRQASESRLPAEYQEVKYLESSGTQYVLTGFSPDVDGLVIELDYMFTASQSGDKYMFYASGNGPLLSAECYNASRWYAYCGLSAFTNVLINTGNTLNVKHKLILDSINDIINIDGTTANKTGNRKQGALYSLTIFANNDGSVPNPGLRIYSFVIKNNGNVSAEFVPCYRKSDLEPGLYNIVSNTFLTNAGAGDFLVGSNV